MIFLITLGVLALLLLLFGPRGGRSGPRYRPLSSAPGPIDLLVCECGKEHRTIYHLTQCRDQHPGWGRPRSASRSGTAPGGSHSSMSVGASWATGWYVVMRLWAG